MWLWQFDTLMCCYAVARVFRVVVKTLFTGLSLKKKHYDILPSTYSEKPTWKMPEHWKDTNWSKSVGFPHNNPVHINVHVMYALICSICVCYLPIWRLSHDRNGMWSPGLLPGPSKSLCQLLWGRGLWMKRQLHAEVLRSPTPSDPSAPVITEYFL